VYFVCSFLRGLYCLKVCSFQLMENRRVSILKLMGMYGDPKEGSFLSGSFSIPFDEYKEMKYEDLINKIHEKTS
ncbi:hypothetical protein P9Z80_08985, partial [Bacillus cereus]|nr:hypothetical protein [Bacillus cereus]